MTTTTTLEFGAFVAALAAASHLEVVPTAGPGTELFDELGLDSFDLLDVILVTEDLADASELPDDVPVPHTLGDLYDHYLRVRRGG